MRSREWENRTVENVSTPIRHSLGEWCMILDEFLQKSTMHDHVLHFSMVLTGAGHFEGRQPSYIYPEALKAVVRARFRDEQATESKPDPEGSSVRTSIHTRI